MEKYIMYKTKYINLMQMKKIRNKEIVGGAHLGIKEIREAQSILRNEFKN
jgi:hypothetical protein